MANANLLGMPLELLVHIIATYLPTEDLGALRLTCKDLDKAFFDTFAKEFFTKKQFMISSHSLGTLMQISEHPTFSRYLNHVIIGLENYESQFDSPREGEKMKLYRNGWADQYNLRCSGRARDMLAQAFRNLPNLQTLGLRDYDANGRVRDGTRWRSYGVSTILRQTGMTLNAGASLSAEYASEMYAVLLRALSDAGKTIPSIEIILRHAQHGMRDNAFYVSPEDTGLQVVLEGLQSLLLTVSLSYSYGRPWTIVYGANGAPAMPPFFITHLSYAKNLKHLRVNFCKGEDANGSRWLVKSLTEAPNILPNLERLEFGKVGLEPQVLVDVIARFSASLKHVTFWDIQLVYATDKHWHDSEDRFHPWPALLRTLCRLPKLESLTVGRISQSAGLYGHLRIGLEGNKFSQECKGDMKVEIPKLIAGFNIDWPKPPPVVTDDEDDNSEYGEDEEDEDEDMDNA